MKPVTVPCPRLLDEHVACEATLQVTIDGEFGDEWIDEITSECPHTFTEEEREAILMKAILEVCDRENDRLEYAADAAFDTLEERDMHERDMRGE